MIAGHSLLRHCKHRPPPTHAARAPPTTTLCCLCLGCIVPVSLSVDCLLSQASPHMHARTYARMQARTHAHTHAHTHTVRALPTPTRCCRWLNCAVHVSLSVDRLPPEKDSPECSSKEPHGEPRLVAADDAPSSSRTASPAAAQGQTARIRIYTLGWSRIASPAAEQSQTARIRIYTLGWSRIAPPAVAEPDSQHQGSNIGLPTPRRQANVQNKGPRHARFEFC